MAETDNLILNPGTGGLGADQFDRFVEPLLAIELSESGRRRPSRGVSIREVGSSEMIPSRNWWR